MTTQIANEDLFLEKIPNPEGESSDYQETWEKFALTMNGYEVCGDFESCSDLASQVIKEPKNASLTELRSALFFYSVVIVGTNIQILQMKTSFISSSS